MARKFGQKREICIDPLAYNIGLIGESGIGKSTVIKEVCEKLAGDEGYIALDIGKEDTINTKSYIDLLNIIQIQKPEVIITKESTFTSKVVVVTGTLQHFTRDSITAKLEKLGAKVSGSVSKKTDYLIAGEKVGSKLLKAQQLGVTVLTEDQFVRMVS